MCAEVGFAGLAAAALDCAERRVSPARAGVESGNDLLVVSEVVCYEYCLHLLEFYFEKGGWAPRRGDPHITVYCLT